MRVTVIICTYNRASLLNNTLAQLTDLDLSSCAAVEILVVNNNSTDDTDAVIRRHSEHLPIRRLWEPRPGKSRAANRAVREARGDLLLWTDDDVLVERGWLKAYVEAAQAYPHVSFFGGPIEPWFETDPPAWILRHYPLIAGCFAVRDAFEERFAPIRKDYMPYGANMAMRRHCLDTCSFDVRLGPEGDNQIGDEDGTLLQALLATGMQGLWVKEASVRHFIPKARLTEPFIWKFHCGRGKQGPRVGDVRARLWIFGVPAWAVRGYLGNLVVSKLLSPTKSERWLRALTRAARCRGVLKELRQQRISAQNRS
jgi:glucosyl-dolichyl phosphate glucuronosyltransferase